MNRLTVILVVALLVVAVAAMANPAFNTAFTKTYKPKAGTALAKAGCATCHTKMGSPVLNPYGNQLKGKPATAASLKAVDNIDSDKDGISNIAEIKAGTLPGNAKSKPSPKCPPAKPKR